MKGWIKLHRKSLNSAVWHNEKSWKVWCYCLLRANHKEVSIPWNGSQRLIRAGQFIVGRFEGAKDCKMKEPTFYYQLKKLERMGNLSISSDSKSSLVTIVNWAQYQVSADYSNSTSDTNLTPTYHRQEGENDENVFVDRLVNFLKDDKIDFSEPELRARMPKAIQRFGQRNIIYAINSARDTWKSKGHTGNFIKYFFTVLESDYSENSPSGV